MTEEHVPERGAAEDNSGAPLTETEVEAGQRPPSAPSRDEAATREAEEAHGGSMAPSLVDDFGNPVGDDLE